MANPFFNWSHQPIRIAGRVWQALTEPAVALRGHEQRQRARTLSALLVFGMIVIFWFLVVYGFLLGALLFSVPKNLQTLLFNAAILFALVPVYRLSRTSHYTLAATLTIGLGFGWTLIATIFLSQTRISFATLFICVLASSLFFAWRGTTLVWLAALFELLGLSCVTSPRAWDYIVEQLYVMGVAGVVILITVWVRDQRLKKITQQRQTLARSNSLIMALSQIAAQIAASPDARQIMDTVGHELWKLKIWSAIALHDAEKEEVVQNYFSPDPAKLAWVEKTLGINLDTWRLPLDRWPITEIFATKQPLVIRDVIRVIASLLDHIDRAAIERSAQILGAGSQSTLALLPLLNGERVIGVMAVWSQNLQAEDMPALLVLATQVATALEKARWLVAEQAQTTELRRASEQLRQELAARQRTEAALRESEEQYRAVVEDQTELICRWLPDGTLTFVNGAYCRYFGKTREELVGHCFMPLIFEPDREYVHRQISLLSLANPVTSYEQRSLLPSGEIRWQQWTDRWIVDPKSAIVECQSVGRDITERKQTEQVLKQSEERFRVLFDRVSNIAVQGYAPDGTVRLWNRASEKIYGYSAAEAIGKNLVDLIIPPEMKPAVRQAIQSMFEHSEPIPPEELWLMRKDGSRVPVFSNHTIVEISGFGKELYCIDIELTERKRAEQEIQRLNADLERRVAERTAELEAANRTLRESEERFRLIAETIDEVFYMSDPEMNQIFYISPGYADVWGRSPASLYENPRAFVDTVHPEDRARVIRNLALQQTGQSVMDEYRIIRPDGTVRWIWERNFPVQPVAGRETVYVGVVQDITDRKRAEAQLETSLREKEALLKEVHHRVKNNLQVISSMLNLQAGSVMDPQFVEIVQNSQSRIDSIALIHEKLYRSTDLARIDFRDYLDDLTSSLYSMYHPATSVQLEKDLLDVYFGIDTAIPLGLIVNELVSNSLKYAFPNPTPQENKIYLSLKVLPEGEYLLRIGDNGVGLPAGLDYQHTESLGLQLVITLVEQLDGMLTLRTDHGTEFQIVFHEVKYKPR